MIKINELFYYLFFLMLFGFRAIGGYEGWACYPYVLVAGAVFFALAVASKEHTLTEYLIMGALLILAGIVYLRTGEKGLLLDFMMMLGIKDVPIKRLFRLSAVFLGGSMAILSFLCAFGLMQDVRFGPHRVPIFGYIMRRSLGYPHVNTLMTTYVILMMLILYLVGVKDRNRLLRVSLLTFFGAVYLFLYCDSKTGILISIGFLVINALTDHLIDKPAAKWLIYGLYPVINAAVFAGMARFLPRDTSVRVNSSFGERFRLAAMYWKELPVTLFGSRLVIPMERGEDYGIDISQIYLFLNLGIAAFIVVSILYFILIRDLLKRCDSGALSITLMLMIMGISDPFLYNLSCKNLTFLFMGAALYRLTERVAEKLPAVFSRRILPAGFGTKPLPERFTGACERLAGRAGRFFGVRPGAAGRIAPAVVGVLAALLTGFLLFSRVEPGMTGYDAAVFECVRMGLSIGLWSFVILFVLVRIVTVRRNDGVI